MLGIFLAGIVTFVLAFFAYHRSPKFKASWDKLARSTRAFIGRTIAKARYNRMVKKQALWELKQKQAAENREKLMAKLHQEAFGKPMKQGQPKAEKKPNEQKGNLVEKKAWAALLLHSTNWPDLQCWPAVLDMLSSEAIEKNKQRHKYQIEIRRDGVVAFYDERNRCVVQVNSTTGEVRTLEDLQRNPQRYIRNNTQVLEADNRRPAPRRELTADEINAEIAAATQSYDEYYN